MWTGDSMYADTTDMNVKREQYNRAREEPSYLEFGPVSKEQRHLRRIKNFKFVFSNLQKQNEFSSVSLSSRIMELFQVTTCFWSILYMDLQY